MILKDKDFTLINKEIKEKIINFDKLEKEQITKIIDNVYNASKDKEDFDLSSFISNLT